MLSIIIPTYNDPYLQKTIDSLLANAQGEIEIIPVLDGYTPPEPIKGDSRVTVINIAKNRGMRGAINAGIAASEGDFIMKCDAHCLFAPGFDKIMAQNCAPNWLMIPRRYSLDVDNWQRGGNSTISDYHYLSFPVKTVNYGTNLSIQNWFGRTRARRDSKYDIDDTMTFQGSCWFANRKYFMKQVGFLDDRKETYGPWSGDGQEIGLKYWLGGAEIKVIKKTWYAHLNKRPHQYKKGLFTREYKVNPDSARGHTWTAKHWINNEEPGMIHPLSWLVEKFWPVPTWPENRSLWVFPKDK